MDEQTELLKSFDRRIEANTLAVKDNKVGIAALQKKMEDLKTENNSLRYSCEEQARYKRRWNLRMIGLPEKEGEDTREVVIGILTRVVPMSVDRLRETVDTVHRVGRKGNAATSNNTPRSIIIQFGMMCGRDRGTREYAPRCTYASGKISPKKTARLVLSCGQLFRRRGKKESELF
ncbi:hypothetical protein DPEC_G00311730 [Dallia pectoralis]|uniref:Uncharacterized protein n=1 Tax=Dallia pectoralis TaxID=75939 RepID=A0ACC2FBG8_DALPE|nr:hypothetical protein DPEC_G00311730 [Dallia pectoralis]